MVLLLTIESNDYCPICLRNKKDVMSLECSHTFCRICISKWLEKNNTCPICRKTQFPDVETPIEQMEPDEPNVEYHTIQDVHYSNNQKLVNRIIGSVFIGIVLVSILLLFTFKNS